MKSNVYKYILLFGEALVMAYFQNNATEHVT